MPYHNVILPIFFSKIPVSTHYLSILQHNVMQTTLDLRLRRRELQMWLDLRLFLKDLSLWGLRRVEVLVEVYLSRV